MEIEPLVFLSILDKILIEYNVFVHCIGLIVMSYKLFDVSSHIYFLNILSHCFFFFAFFVFTYYSYSLLSVNTYSLTTMKN